ncbi:HlyD family secretion protein [Rhizobium sp. Root1220]|uniref:HlyD family secretion protein n=1 Tax=Rhizobium sp. Root1220 TaxID=1736432 RepID=UPI0009E74F30|nr:HlyD family secretion protein [Rhizobium sp. Root1220]
MAEATRTEPIDPDRTVPRTGIQHRRWRRLVVGIGSLLALLVVWQVLTSIIAYTDDAYVHSELVTVAPQVAGVIVSLQVGDNQAVKRGDLLAVIDRMPFQLARDDRRAAVQEANAERDGGRDDMAIARDQLTTAEASLKYATEEQARLATLSGDEAVSQEQLERANELLQRATTQQATARASIDRAAQSLARLEALAARAESALALAEWQLGQTEIRAPVDGTINNLNLSVGDSATVGKALIGIVDDAGWRIIANYKEGYIRDMQPGETAWVWLDTHPWRFYRARIQGIARGISRGASEDAILPYVAPTTDWIRLSRRFPVTFTLVDPPPDLTLYMGADARTLIFR